ncbi:MAG TPA: DUF167 family protein [Rhizomicrobium sp.]|nr:DUF167 family protein [Rhizomicrobium sp.]
MRSAASGAVIIPVRLTPRGGRNGIDGWMPDAKGGKHLAVRVTAAAESGKANAALIELLADRLSVAKSSIRIVRGFSARMKTIEVSADPVSIRARLAELGTAQ